MTLASFRLHLPLLAPDGDTGAPAPSAPASPVAPAAPPTATTSAPAASVTATPQTPPSTPPEDRSNWVPRHRIDETRRSVEREWQQNLQAREAAMRAEIDRRDAQIRALTGVTPPPDPGIASVKTQFGQLFPTLSQLEDAGITVDQLKELIASRQSLDAVQQNHWRTHASRTMDSLHTMAEKTFGQPLTTEAKAQLHTAFTGWVGSSPELISRYEEDPSIVQDFWNQFTSTFIEPARRGAAAATAARAGAVATLPQDAPSGALRPSTAPAPKSMDERVAAGWTQFQQLKGGGGQ